ncbi:MAG: hypothetical protein A2104_06815 [Candidatus Melainabacteria bacterium GWF2_32_7]|nr:MAG: hypothetical protein A2104_06815 [Candidatus Melainabacteria bacterium GWF2_32_7]
MIKEKPKRIAVASCTGWATEAAGKVIESGGNAFDAAICAAFELMISNPLMCSIGGGGFAAVKSANDEVKIIDFFDCMPGKGLNKGLFGKNARIVDLPYGTGIQVISGHSSIGVPGTLKGLEYISKQYGLLPLKEVLQPAITNAVIGVPMNSPMARYLAISAGPLHWFTEYSKKLLSTPDGEIPKEGFLYKNPDLANTLNLIAQYGSDIVYKGEIGEKIVNEVQSGGGILTLEDLSNYDVIIRKPIFTEYGKYKIYTNPPPSVGGLTLIQMLKVISRLNVTEYNPVIVSKLGKIIHTALTDRYSCIEEGRKDFKEYFKLAEDNYILEKYKNILPSPSTTHISCVDDLGNACSITMSIGYGSGVAIPETGILMDNVLGELELNPLGFHALDPGERLVSSMSPTIIYDDFKKDMLVLGTPGASRIATSLMQIIININNLNMSLKEALSAPRIHWEDNKFALEAGRDFDESEIPPEWEVVRFPDIDMYFGGIQCVKLFGDGNLDAASDPRRCGVGKVFKM